MTRIPSTKVIFLDVDGVLNDNFGVRSTEGSFYKDMMEQLRLLVQNTQAKIVLHSSWGFCPKMEHEVESALYNYGLRLYDNVYRINKELFRSTEELNKYDRDWFIQDWLKYHPEVTNYVVLDDWDISEQFPDHFVHTFREPPFGLTEKVRLQAEAILNKEVTNV